ARPPRRLPARGARSIRGPRRLPADGAGEGATRSPRTPARAAGTRTPTSPRRRTSQRARSPSTSWVPMLRRRVRPGRYPPCRVRSEERDERRGPGEVRARPAGHPRARRRVPGGAGGNRGRARPRRRVRGRGGPPPHRGSRRRGHPGHDGARGRGRGAPQGAVDGRSRGGARRGSRAQGSRRPGHGPGARGGGSAPSVRPRPGGGRVDRRIHGDGPDHGGSVARASERDLRPGALRGGRGAPRRAHDRPRVRRRGGATSRARHDHGERTGTALPHPQGHHAGQAEARRTARADRPRSVRRRRRPDATGARAHTSAGARRRRGRPGGRGHREAHRRPPRRGEGALEVPAVFVYAELTPEGPLPVALELLTKARSLGDTVAAVALGPGASAAAETLGAYGAATVFASDDPVFAETVGHAAALALAGLVEEHRPALVLFSTSHDARDVAGRLQSLTGSTLMSNATDLPATDRAEMPVFGGAVTVEVALGGPDPKIVLVRPTSFAAQPSGGSATVVPVPVPHGSAWPRRVERHE